VADAERVVQCRQRFVEEIRQVGASRDALRDRPHRGQVVPLRRGAGRRVPGHLLDREHAVDVGALQLEHAAIPVCDAMPARCAFIRSNKGPPVSTRTYSSARR
jgi:hypothetical protein